MDILSIFSLPVILFLLTVVFGFWLSKVGKPYNGILFNFHKLIALGTVILAAIRAFNLVKGASPHFPVILLFIVAGLCAVALFTSGALMSLEKLDYRVTLTVHRIAPIFVVIATGMVVYFLSSGQ
jgi:hypothetical protein